MMYWVYDYSNITFAIATVATFVAFGILGVLVTRWYLGRQQGDVSDENDVVSFYFSAIVGFYGITLGLISVGVWQTFSEADHKSTIEAAAVESLFRDVSSLREPARSLSRGALEKYVQNVIEVAWPMQRKGEIPKGGSEIMSELQAALFPFEPQTTGQSNIHAEALSQYNRLSELRRLRVLSATSGLPASTWWVVISGAAASIIFTWMFVVQSRARHIFLTGLFSALLGLLIFLIAALDNPYRGEYSVGSDAFELVLDRMKKM